MIAGLIAPDSGRLELDGREIVEPGPDRGVVFRNYSLLPWLTVYDNIALAVDSLFDLWSTDRKTALMVTHDVDEALFLSDRVVMMTNGPNATVGDIPTVPFPRPRDRAAVMEHPDYDALRESLVGFLERQGHKPDTDAEGHAPSRAPPAAPATVAEKTSAKVPAAHRVAPRTVALATPTR